MGQMWWLFLLLGAACIVSVQGTWYTTEDPWSEDLEDCIDEGNVWCRSPSRYNDFRCIDQSRFCDGVKDCRYNEDEDRSECEVSCAASGGFFWCKNSFGKFNCITQDGVCDGYIDCNNRQDENQILCEASCQVQGGDNAIWCRSKRSSSIYTCAENHELCDGEAECYYYEDENADLCRDSCLETNSSIWCRSRDNQNQYVCVDEDRQCDGFTDCSSHADENTELCDAYCNVFGADEHAVWCREYDSSDSYVCLPSNATCDGKLHCYHHEDENSDRCHNLCNETSASNIWCRTRSNSRRYSCVGEDGICDGRQQCLNSEDELPSLCGAQCEADSGVGSAYCRSTWSSRRHVCIPPTKVCDSTKHCFYGEDENSRECRERCINDSGSTSVWCGDPNSYYNRVCIKQDEICDGKRDCRNNEDESYSLCEDCRSDNSSIWCGSPYTSYSSACVPERKICDGHRDCRYYEDEDNELCQELCNGFETDDSIWCRSRYDRDTYVCIDSNKTCDGKRDCYYAEDESNDLCQELCTWNGTYDSIWCRKRSNYNLFVCIDEDQVCDGMSDCSDGADEKLSLCQGDFNNLDVLGDELCTWNGTYGSIWCRKRSNYNLFVCIDEDQVCDGMSDCYNEEDEKLSLCQEPCELKEGQDSLWCRSANHYHRYTCVSADQLCDGRRHCYSNEDERLSKCRECGGHLNAPRGVITSVYYPSNYIDNLYCVWYITAPIGKRIELTFERFELEISSSCYYDYVTVQHTASNEDEDDTTTVSRYWSRSLDRYCGYQGLRKLYSERNLMIITFITDHSVTRRGFRMSYATFDSDMIPSPSPLYSTEKWETTEELVRSTTEDPPTMQCGENLYGPSGEITSVNYPNNYTNGLHCVWNITADIGSRIMLIVEDFELEWNSHCTFDYVTVDYAEHDGTMTSSVPPQFYDYEWEGRRNGRLCGFISHGMLYSEHNRMTITFRTDSSVTRRGFKLRYITFKSDDWHSVTESISTTFMDNSESTTQDEATASTSTTSTTIPDFSNPDFTVIELESTTQEEAELESTTREEPTATNSATSTNSRDSSNPEFTITELESTIQEEAELESTTQEEPTAATFTALITSRDSSNPEFTITKLQSTTQEEAELKSTIQEEAELESTTQEEPTASTSTSSTTSRDSSNPEFTVSELESTTQEEPILSTSTTSTTSRDSSNPEFTVSELESTTQEEPILSTSTTSTTSRDFSNPEFTASELESTTQEEPFLPTSTTSNTSRGSSNPEFTVPELESTTQEEPILSTSTTSTTSRDSSNPEFTASELESTTQEEPILSTSTSSTTSRDSSNPEFTVSELESTTQEEPILSTSTTSTTSRDSSNPEFTVSELESTTQEEPILSTSTTSTTSRDFSNPEFTASELESTTQEEPFLPTSTTSTTSRGSSIPEFTVTELESTTQEEPTVSTTTTSNTSRGSSNPEFTVPELESTTQEEATASTSTTSTRSSESSNYREESTILADETLTTSNLVSTVISSTTQLPPTTEDNLEETTITESSMLITSVEATMSETSIGVSTSTTVVVTQEETSSTRQITESDTTSQPTTTETAHSTESATTTITESITSETTLASSTNVATETTSTTTMATSEGDDDDDEYDKTTDDDAETTTIISASTTVTTRSTSTASSSTKAKTTTRPIIDTTADDIDQTTSTAIPTTEEDLWTQPGSWSSDRIYPWGPTANDYIKTTGRNFPNYTREYYSNWRYCDQVYLNGKLGFPFKDATLEDVYICGNGMLQFRNRYMWSYPYRHGMHSYFNRYGLIGAFWGYSDHYTLDQYSDLIEEPNAKSKVYYHEHTDLGSDTSDVSKGVLARAKEDVSSLAPEEFEPTSVLVVTAINMAQNKQYCFNYGLGVTIYEYIIARYYENCFYGWCWYYSYWRSYYESRLDYYRSRVLECTQIIGPSLKNHYQTVLITDGFYSFVKFNYPEEGINWAHPDIDDYSENFLENFYGYSRYTYSMAVGGWSAPVEDVYASYEARQHAASLSAMAVNVNNSAHLLLEKVDSKPGNTGKEGEWLWRTDNYLGEDSARQVCMRWALTSAVKSWFNIFLYAREYPCAESVWDAWWDWGRFSFWKYYYSTRQYCLYRRPSWLDSRPYRSVCCYNFDWYKPGYLMLTQGHINRGGYTVDLTDADENIAHRACCDLYPPLCAVFYAMRRPATTVGYVPVIRRMNRGDPHLTTLDGVPYSFNGLGEYQVFNNGENGTTVHARTARVVNEDGELGQATYFSAVALNFENLGPIHLQVNNETETTDPLINLEMYVNGSRIDFSTLVNGNSTQNLDDVDDNYQFDKSNNSLLVISPDGAQLNVSVNLGFMSISMTVTSDHANKTKGLVGYYDNDAGNDFYFPNSSQFLPTNSTSSEIFDWALSWSVSANESILYYPDGMTQSDFVDNSFVPIFGEDLISLNWSSDALKQQALSTCGDNTECLFDVYSTGNLAVGENTKSVGEEADSISAGLANPAPTLSGQANLTVIIGEPIEIYVEVSDNNITTVNITAYPVDAVTVNTTNQETGSVTVNVLVTENTNLTAFSLTVTADDELGKTAVYQPTVYLCGCRSNGTCGELNDREIEDATSSTLIRPCTCTEGLTGQFCEIDLDACSLNADSCFPGVLCADKPAPAGANDFDCGDCPTGYTGDGQICEDINECVDPTYNTCEQNCFNAAGSFGCTCNEGYTLNADEESCSDVDECQLDVCHQVCENTVGSFICSCESSIWKLSADNINCEPSNPCSTNNNCDPREGIGYCSQNAETGDQSCLCARGYELANDDSICEDIDECLFSDPVCADTCNNTEGSYECGCSIGYKLARDGSSCNDLNECAFGEFTCFVGADCINTIGSYDCACPAGSTPTDGVCVVASMDEPAPTSTSATTDEQNSASIVLLFNSTTSDELTVNKLRQLYSIIASNLTTYCAENIAECQAASARRKRDVTTAPVFTSDLIGTVQGYPNSTGTGVEIAFYVEHPSAGFLSTLTLIAVIQQSEEAIEALLGPLHFSLLIPTTTSAPSTAVVIPIEEGTQALVISLATIGGVLLVTIFIVVLVVGLKKRSKQQVGQISIQHIEEEAWTESSSTLRKSTTYTGHQ